MRALWINIKIEIKSLSARGYTFVDEMKELSKTRSGEPEILFNYIKEIIQKIIVYKNDNIEKLKKREIGVDGTYDEILTNLESEIRNYIKVFFKRLFSGCLEFLIK